MTALLEMVALATLQIYLMIYLVDITNNDKKIVIKLAKIFNF